MTSRELFGECRICNSYFKSTCNPSVQMNEEIPAKYAKEVFLQFVQPIVKNSKFFKIKMTNWKCAEGELLQTYNLWVECEGKKYVHQLRFDERKTPDHCNTYNICAFIYRMIVLLEEHNCKQTDIKSALGIYNSTLWNWVNFSRKA